MFITNRNPNWKEGLLSDLVTIRYGKDHKKLADLRDTLLPRLMSGTGKLDVSEIEF